jgi:hypothetical protein
MVIISTYYYLVHERIVACMIVKTRLICMFLKTEQFSGTNIFHGPYLTSLFFLDYDAQYLVICM